jgi:hypothetical protein
MAQTTQHVSYLPGSEMDNGTANENNTVPRHAKPDTIGDISSASPRLQLSGWKWHIMQVTMFLTTLLLGKNL